MNTRACFCFDFEKGFDYVPWIDTPNVLSRGEPLHSRRSSSHPTSRASTGNTKILMIFQTSDLLNL